MEDERDALAGAAALIRELVHPDKFSIFLVTKGGMRAIWVEG